MGCDQTQGFVLSRPLGVAAFEDLMTALPGVAVTSPL
jgi:EAL domain-containing protein (putative c-di-GMP-specific phosphodiesterase class I)